MKIITADDVDVLAVANRVGYKLFHAGPVEIYGYKYVVSEYYEIGTMGRKMFANIANKAFMRTYIGCNRVDCGSVVAELMDGQSIYD